MEIHATETSIAPTPKDDAHLVSGSLQPLTLNPWRCAIPSTVDRGAGYLLTSP